MKSLALLHVVLTVHHSHPLPSLTTAKARLSVAFPRILELHSREPLPDESRLVATPLGPRLVDQYQVWVHVLPISSEI